MYLMKKLEQIEYWEYLLSVKFFVFPSPV